MNAGKYFFLRPGQLIKIYLISFFFILSFVLHAQDRIDADRPDQTESVTNVPKKYFQAEFGFGKINSSDRNYDLDHPSFLFKYGLTQKVELRLEGNYGSSYVHLIPNPKSSSALEPIEIGTRIMLVEEKKLRPKISLLAHLGLPFTSSNYDHNQKFFPSIRASFQNSLSASAGLGYNVGAQWDGYSNSPVWLYTFSPNVNLGKKWYAYVEAFGFFKSGENAQHNLDAGLAYFTSDNTKVDLSGGIGLGNDNPLRNYVAAGFSFRVRTGKHKTTEH